MTRVSLPQTNVPLVDKNGLIGTDWYQSLVAIMNRTGGTADDFIAQSIRVATTGIVVCTDPTDGTAVTRSLAAGTGLSVSNADGIAGDPALALADTAVTPNSYGDATHVVAFTVDAQGRITAAASTAISYPVSSAFGRTGAVAATNNDYTFAQIGPGTTTNDNATAGEVGEYVESVVTFASPVSVSSATQTDLTSISLTAGDWDVEGNLVTVPDATTTTGNAIAGLSSTSATLPNPELRGWSSAATAGNTLSVALPRTRFSLAGTTTIYLVADVFFAVSTMGISGFINARRVR